MTEVERRHREEAANLLNDHWVPGTLFGDWVETGGDGTRFAPEQRVAKALAAAEERGAQSRPVKGAATGDRAAFACGETVHVYDRDNDKVLDTLRIREVRFRYDHFIYALEGKPGFYSETFLESAVPFVPASTPAGQWIRCDAPADLDGIYWLHQGLGKPVKPYCNDCAGVMFAQAAAGKPEPDR